jgi:hypothetical protein
MSNRLDKEREKELQPQRMQFAIDELDKLGIPIDLVDEVKIKFKWKGHYVTLFPYSGWHTGKSIKDGRGINNLLKQLK